MHNLWNLWNLEGLDMFSHCQGLNPLSVDTVQKPVRKSTENTTEICLLYSVRSKKATPAFIKCCLYFQQCFVYFKYLSTSLNPFLPSIMDQYLKTSWHPFHFLEGGASHWASLTWESVTRENHWRMILLAVKNRFPELPSSRKCTGCHQQVFLFQHSTFHPAHSHILSAAPKCHTLGRHLNIHLISCSWNCLW